MSNNVIPILLSDDGMRVIKQGHTISGDHPYLVQHNPGLIARAIEEKRYREIIKTTNERLWKAA